MILAGVSIAMLTGENGILTQAQKAGEQTDIGKEKEDIALAYNGAKAENNGGGVDADDLNRNFGYNDTGATAEGSNPITVTFTESKRTYTIDSNGNISDPTTGTTPIPPTTGSTLGTVTGDEETNTTVQDSLGNKVVVPAGFKVQNPEDNVEDGIVIVDKNHGATAGSEFVWIPVGTIHTSNGDKTIKLSRYKFDDSGVPTDQGENAISTNWQELASSTYGNATAKNIEEFKTSVEENGGYYLGRYEARTAIERTDKTDPLTQITTKPDEYVYIFVTQIQAAEQSQNMYTSEYFESDLVNSYAWDTAIVFLQECDDRADKTKPYSRQNSLNTEFAEKGTNGTETEDVICNIYDMASNCYEWSTETCSNASPCVFRGGNYRYSGYTSRRGGNYATTSRGVDSFRPLLYL